MPCVSELATVMSETAPIFTFGVMDQWFVLADQILLTGHSGVESSRTFPNESSPLSEFAFRLQPIIHLVPKAAIPRAIDFIGALSDFVLAGWWLLSHSPL